jgi:hypothetical protein
VVTLRSDGNKEIAGHTDRGKQEERGILEGQETGKEGRRENDKQIRTMGSPEQY